MKMVIKMEEYRSHVAGIVNKICGLYPEIDHDAYLNQVLNIKLVENEDVTDKKPLFFDPISGTIKVNSLEIATGKYDLDYYMTVAMLMMRYPYNNELDGIRYGFNSGIASSLVGNTVLETSNEVENGIDVYEPLRDCVQDLNNKIGADATIRLCSSITLEDFATYYSEIGLQSLEEFLDQTTYLLKNGINITEKQSEGLVTDIKNSQPAVEIALNPAKSLS